MQGFGPVHQEVGEPMFKDDGSEGPGLKRAIEFLNAYRVDARRTQDLMAELKRLDLLIPRLGGLGVLGRIHAIDPALPVIMMAGSSVPAALSRSNSASPPMPCIKASTTRQPLSKGR